MAVSAQAAPSVAARAERWFLRRQEEERQRLRWVIIGAILVALYPFVDEALGLGLMGSLIPMFVPAGM